MSEAGEHFAVADDGDECQIQTLPDGDGASSLANLRFHYQESKLCFFYDVRSRSFLVSKSRKGKRRKVSDRWFSKQRVLIRAQRGFTPLKTHIWDAVESLCYENTVDPVATYLRNCPEPTRKARRLIKRWLVHYCGADDTELNRAIGVIVLVAAVRRALHAGCRFDLLLVLIGKQGAGKTKAFRILARKQRWYSDQEIMNLRAQEQREQLQGVWLYELSELGGMDKTTNEKVKAFLSRTRDFGRAAYARDAEGQRRRCIFVATTNQEQFLTDETGNRRFIPVKVGKIKLKALREDADDLWAAAVELEKSGYSLTLPKHLWADAAKEQDRRVEHDPWVDELSGVQGVQHGDRHRVSFADLAGHLGLGRASMSRATFKRLKAVMHSLGWKMLEKPFNQGGKTVRGFWR